MSDKKIREVQEGLEDIIGGDVLDNKVLDPDVGKEEKTKKPRRYQVILHNNDYVNGFAVAAVLSNVFGMDEDQGMNLMRSVHLNGKGVVMVTTKDIAETKIDEAQSMLYELGAFAEGFEEGFVIFSMEPEDDGEED
jgi:ATP-dependent Clp protease adaptor protein ClpS